MSNSGIPGAKGLGSVGGKIGAALGGTLLGTLGLGTAELAGAAAGDATEKFIDRSTAIPPPLDNPETVTPENAGPKVDDAQADVDKKTKRGRASTMLSGGSGLLSPGQTSRHVLLGS